MTRAWRSLVAAMAVALALWALPAPVAAGQEACEALHEAVPERVAGFTLRQREVYEDRAAGFAALYQSRDGARMSMFHYLGAGAPPRAEDVPDALRREMGRIAAYMRGQGLTPTPAFRVPLADGRNPVAAQQGFRERPGLRDITALGVVRGCLVKLRYTGAPLETPTLRRMWAAASGG